MEHKAIQRVLERLAAEDGRVTMGGLRSHPSSAVYTRRWWLPPGGRADVPPETADLRRAGVRRGALGSADPASPNASPGAPASCTRATSWRPGSGRRRRRLPRPSSRREPRPSSRSRLWSRRVSRGTCPGSTWLVIGFTTASKQRVDAELLVRCSAGRSPRQRRPAALSARRRASEARPIGPGDVGQIKRSVMWPLWHPANGSMCGAAPRCSLRQRPRTPDTTQMLCQRDGP